MSAKTIDDYMAEIRPDDGPAQYDIWHRLDDLRREYGGSATGPWVVYTAEFHGGLEMSRHRSALAAVKAARRDCCGPECKCSGARVKELKETV
jgi:hypothetical protein